MKRLLHSIPPTTSTKLSRSSNLFHSLGPDLGLGGVVGEESLGLLEEEVDFGEGLVTDVLPADVAGGIDEEGAVEGNFFEIVVNP